MARDGRLAGTQEGEKTNLWRGTKTTFQRLERKGLIKEGWIYMVGDASIDAPGLNNSKEGIIYIGLSGNRYVKFGGGDGSKGEKGDKGDKGDPGETPDLTDIYEQLSESTNMVEAVGWYKAAYDASHKGENEYQKVLTIKPNTFVVLNVVSHCFGSPNPNIIMFSAMGEACMRSLMNTEFVWAKDSDGFHIYAPTFKYATPAVPSYVFQIVQCYYDRDNLEFHNTENIYQTVSKVNNPQIIYQAAPPTADESLTFNIRNSAASIDVSEYSDFIGDVKDSSNSATIAVSNSKVSKIYRFTFTKNLEDGIVITNPSGMRFCKVEEQISQGETITFTSVVNDADGWVYQKQNASIMPADDSIEIEWKDGIPYIKAVGGFDPSTLAAVATSGSSEDLTDRGYGGLFVCRSINNDTGEPSSSSGWGGSISGAKSSNGYRDFVHPNYIDSWVKLYTPFILGKAKEKKVYYVPNSASYNIPSDADAVILRRDDFPDDTDEMAQDYINITLPSTADPGKRIDIICTNFSKQTQKSILLYVKAQSGYYSEGSGYLYMLYQGVAKTFIFDGNTSDYNGGWLYK